MIFSYARVSSLEQCAEGTTSIVEQERRNRAVASLRGAGTFDFAAFADEGVSGTIPLKDRPAGKEMLAAAKRGDTIIACKLDRLFRSSLDALATAEMFKEQGIALISIDLGVEPLTGNGVSKVFFGMLAVFADFEREKIAERFADGKRAKRRQHNGSGHAGGPAPFGYSVVGQGREARRVENPKEQEILKAVKKLSKELSSPWVIGKRLNEQGFRDRKGNEFRVPQVQRMMARVSA